MAELIESGQLGCKLKFTLKVTNFSEMSASKSRFYLEYSKKKYGVLTFYLIPRRGSGWGGSGIL